VQYQFELVTGKDSQRLNDPNNPLLSRSPVGDCSVCFGPGYVEPAWASVRTDTAPGQLVELRLHSQAQQRDNRVTVYLPAGFSLTARYPLLVVHDGGDYLGYAAMKAVLDNLIAAGDVAPLLAAFIYPGLRLTEYADDPRHAAWVARELVPELETRYPLEARATGRCLMGASFGAVASLATAVRYPQAFSALLLQSGSFVYSGPTVNHGEDSSFVPVITFVDSYRADPVRVADRCFISCGAYEDLIDANRGMLPVFQQTGMAINYVESIAGHSWEAGRDQLRDALRWIFPAVRP
jgi:enterochelin esterase-like enzyme